MQSTILWSSHKSILSLSLVYTMMVSIIYTILYYHIDRDPLGSNNFIYIFIHTEIHVGPLSSPSW